MICAICKTEQGSSEAWFERWGTLKETEENLCSPCLDWAMDHGAFPEPPDWRARQGSREEWNEKAEIDMVPNDRVIEEARDRLFSHLAPTEKEFLDLYAEYLVRPKDSYHRQRLLDRWFKAGDLQEV